MTSINKTWQRLKKLSLLWLTQRRLGLSSRFVDLILLSSLSQATLLSTEALHVQSFSLHIGGDLKIPTVDKRRTHVVESVPQLSASERAAASDPFAGLPLRAWADRVGDRVAPAFKAVQEEQRASNLAAAKRQRLDAPLAVPDIPHVFPITRW